MIELRRTCPQCQHPEIVYSVGVIRSRRPYDQREFPLVRCEQCHDTYFTRYPFLEWYSCGYAVDIRITFTNDPAMIDPTIKLEYATKGIHPRTVFRPVGTEGAAAEEA